ncbi:uncharacterized protein LOC114287397 isoform X1 [Camellia sinensis]|uniref:uncharacterized protein LOC114287397 isoform X1 n=1 Tax=Camellia sinensis TaxID=4442 RepID=UPI0010368574|nr:uncharacterized protein LOC114287397 isoform X1 [Camellia sinensis]
MECVFGSTFVCKTIDAARAVAFNREIGTPSVTLDGDIFQPSGLLTGGSRKCAETYDILPDGFKLKKEDGVYYMSYAMGRGCLTFGEMMQKISDLKDGSTMERLYMLIFISGKNKNENMEMECVIEFPHMHMDRRPRRSRLGWDVAPQALRKEQQRKTLNDCPNTNFGGLVTLRNKMRRF